MSHKTISLAICAATPHNIRQADKMRVHMKDCKYEGAGKITRSFRLNWVFRFKCIERVPQMKCCGCGYSLDID